MRPLLPALLCALLTCTVSMLPDRVCERSPNPIGEPVYGLMITKDDGPIFNEWLVTHMPFLDALAVLDGSEWDATTARSIEMYKEACPERAGSIYFISERMQGMREMIQVNTDQQLRKFPLQFLRVHHQTVEERRWVMLLHPDEYLYHDPRLVAAVAQADGADHVLWAALEVLPHPSERDDMHHPSLPFRQRHFHHDFEHSRIPLLEGRMFRDGPDVQFGVRHLHTLPDEGLHKPWNGYGNDWRDTLLSRYVRGEHLQPLPAYLHYKTPVVDPSMYTRVDYPSSLYPGTNYTWWLRNGRFSSGLPISRADIEMEDGVEQMGNDTVRGTLAGVGVRHDVSSEDGFFVTDGISQTFFRRDRFDGELERFDWCLPHAFRLDRDWGFEEDEEEEEDEEDEEEDELEAELEAEEAELEAELEAEEAELEAELEAVRGKEEL